MSFDEPYYSGTPYFGDLSRAEGMSLHHDEYRQIQEYRNNPYYMPTYTSMPEGRMQVEQAGFPAISKYMCGTCPQYDNPQYPPMRKMSLDARSDMAISHYPPDHDTRRASHVPCATGFGGGCKCCGGGMTTAAATGIMWKEPMDAGSVSAESAEKKYEPTSSIVISPMQISLSNFIIVFLFIILVYICIAFSRTIRGLESKLALLEQRTSAT